MKKSMISRLRIEEEDNRCLFRKYNRVKVKSLNLASVVPLSTRRVSMKADGASYCVQLVGGKPVCYLQVRPRS